MADVRLGGVFVDFLTRNAQFLRGVQRSGESLRRLQRRVSALRREIREYNRVARSMVRVVSLFAVAGIGLAIRSFAEFGQTMATVRGVAGATEDQFASLRQQALDLGRTTRFSATQAAEGQLFLARASFGVNEILAALPATLRLAQSSMVDVGQAADIVSNILTAFGGTANETDRFVDVLTKATTSANTDLVQLADAMKLVAPVARSLNVDVETTAAAIGVLSDAGLQATLAGTGLRKVMFDLQAATPRTTGILQDLGLTVDQVSIQQNGLIAVLERLAEAGVTATQTIEIFGARGAPAFLNLTRQIPKLRELTETLRGSAGTAEELARVMDDTLVGSFKRVVSAAEGLGIAFIETSGGGAALRDFLDSAADLLNTFTDNIAVNVERVIHLAALFFGAFALRRLTRIGLGFAAFITLQRNQLGLLGGAIATTRTALVGLTRAFVPFLIIEAIIQVIGFFGHLLDEVKSVGSSFGDVAIVASTDLLEGFSRGLIALPGIIVGALAAAGQLIIEGAVAIGVGIKDGIISGVTGGDFAEAFVEGFEAQLAGSLSRVGAVFDFFQTDTSALAGLSDAVARAVGLSAEEIAAARAALGNATTRTVADLLETLGLLKAERREAEAAIADGTIGAAAPGDTGAPDAAGALDAARRTLDLERQRQGALEDNRTFFVQLEDSARRQLMLTEQQVALLGVEGQARSRLLAEQEVRNAIVERDIELQAELERLGEAAAHASLARARAVENGNQTAIDLARTQERLALDALKIAQDAAAAFRSQSLDIEALIQTYERAAEAARLFKEEQDRIAESTQRAQDEARALVGGLRDIQQGLSRGADAAEVFRNAVSRLIDRLLEMILYQPLIDNLANSLKGAGGGAGGILGFLGSLFGGGSASVPYSVSGAPTPRFQTGGYAQPGLAIVGERGRELVDFRQPARVYSNDNLREAIGGGGGPVFNITYAPVIESDNEAAVERGLAAAYPVFRDAIRNDIGADLGRASGLRRQVRR